MSGFLIHILILMLLRVMFWLPLELIRCADEHVFLDPIGSDPLCGWNVLDPTGSDPLCGCSCEMLAILKSFAFTGLHPV